jgi:hypothetical protein
MLLLGMGVRSATADGKTKTESVLEIRSLDPEDCTLGLSFPWGAMAVNHVLFNDHRGPFKAIVESSGKGITVTFDGWGKDRFIASAEKIRVIYRIGGNKEIDFEAKPISGGAVRVQPVGRTVSEGRRVVIRLGERADKGVANVSAEGRRD